MMRRLWILIPLVLLLLSKIPFSYSAQITIDGDTQFQYARENLERGEYRQAVAEFERFIRFFPDDTRVSEARYLIGICHFRNRDFEKARGTLQGVYKAYRPGPTAGKALFLIGESYYEQGVPEEASRYFRMVIEEFRQEIRLKNAALYRLGWSRMQTDQWQEASESFELVDEGSALYGSARDLSAKSLSGERLPGKAPVAAGLMAAALPGLGHAYCNRYKDATIAFLLNGLFVFAAIEAFNEDLELLGGVLTVVGLGLYAGNIYSAVNAAHKNNKKVRDDFRRNLRDQLDLNIFATRDGHLGLALKLDF